MRYILFLFPCFIYLIPFYSSVWLRKQLKTTGSLPTIISVFGPTALVFLTNPLTDILFQGVSYFGYAFWVMIIGMAYYPYLIYHHLVLNKKSTGFYITRDANLKRKAVVVIAFFLLILLGLLGYVKFTRYSSMDGETIILEKAGRYRLESGKAVRY